MRVPPKDLPLKVEKQKWIPNNTSGPGRNKAARVIGRAILEETLPKVIYKKRGYEQTLQKSLMEMDFPIRMR